MPGQGGASGTGTDPHAGMFPMTDQFGRVTWLPVNQNPQPTGGQDAAPRTQLGGTPSGSTRGQSIYLGGPPAAPTSDTGTPAAAAPAPAAPGPAAAQPTMPSDTGGGEDIQTPAVQALSSLANPEKLQQQINPEGWGVESPPQLAIPGERNLPPSSRALATLAGQRGRVY